MTRQSVQSFFLYFLILMGLCFLCYSNPAMAAPKPIGQVVWVKGSVEAIQPDKSKRTLQRRGVIFEQDTIVTASGGSGEIVFTDSSVISLRGGTELKIDKYEYHPDSPNSNAYIATLAKGGFRTITGLISKGKPDTYRVNTPVATIGVRGTVYTVAYTPKGLSLEIIRGAITATNQTGTYELDKASTLPFAQISGVSQPPERTSTKPAALVGQPAVTQSPAPTPAALQEQMNTQGLSGQTAAPPGASGGDSGGSGTTGGSESSTTGETTSGATTTNGESSAEGAGTTTTIEPTTNTPASTGGTKTATEFCIGG